MYFRKLNKKLKTNRVLIVKLKVINSFDKNEIKEIMQDETVKININEKRVKQKANIALINFFKSNLESKNLNFKIISGKTTSFKLLKIINLEF